MISLSIVQHSFSLFRVSDVLVVLLPLEESKLKINSSSNINPGIWKKEVTQEFKKQHVSIKVEKGLKVMNKSL